MNDPSSTARLTDQRRQYAAALDRSFERILQLLVAMPQVERVILFGSYAAGRRDLLTDLDLLVVMVSDQDFINRTATLYQKLEVQVDADLLVYTPEEFDRLKEHGFLKNVLKTGKVVYEKKRTGRG